MINFRAGLMQALLANGHEVTAVAPFDEHAARIEALGVRYLALPMDNKGTHPLRDLRLLLAFVKLFRRERPELVISYTIKPVIYASVAARWSHVPAVSVATGLGTVFLRENLLTKLVEWLYRVSQSRVQKIFFLNEDDMQIFRERKLAPVANMERLPGEGVDLSHFNSVASASVVAECVMSVPRRPLRFLLMARMLWDKGVGEYVEAARYVRKLYPDTEFVLLGFLDVQNPTAISRTQMDEWVQEGVINYLGVTRDVRGAVKRADCVVLPSYYREGIPRTLLEAAAMNRPIITTNSVGCREVVDDGVNGYLCLPKDSNDLARKMVQMIALTSDERKQMGAQGRKKVEREFDERVVISRYFSVISALTLLKAAQN
jgi:glycosyltransferase involved in cell wall biosynthesis